ncbi:putative amidoligase enzyme [Aliiruegeria haliotis]|uniref:Putative amidoligase enzyme n=1 Tax=Aliiruegeria haliotis TaxID=1280846 RepID=A0A2T0RPP9_9RHOB|nr:amidoligase family protein [Aliiruegeria haliotis]PRY23131.1 putative amidoligase enzyme [Aliiruegeria haliotis]
MDIQRTTPSENSPVFAPLPADPSCESPRRVGLEIEFAGLSLPDATGVVKQRFSGREIWNGAGEVTLQHSSIGKIEMYLDTAFRPESESAAAKAGVEIAQSVVPLEIVTEPLLHTDLPQMEALVADLDAAGGHGGGKSLLIGCGLHLNIDLADSEEGSDLPRIALAYALLEGWLRWRDPPELSRRLLPFVDPFPADMVSDLAGMGPGMSCDDLFTLLSRYALSRNQGLDLLPAWAAVAPERYERDGPVDSAVSPRPAYHYRLPDCRIGDAEWSLAYEWDRWQLIENVARRTDLLEALCNLWLAADGTQLLPGHTEWHEAVTGHLGSLATLAPNYRSVQEGG